MTKHLTIFENEGEIDIRAIKTFGVNSKESKNPFGYFGTGLKIAIGILLRNKQKIIIQSGLEVYEFSLTPARIRVDDFEIVTMNGEELGFTSQVGKNWELWMAYRELYCNTLDEGGGVFGASTVPAPVLGKTRVIVEGESFVDTHRSRSAFILSTRPVEQLESVDVHDGGSSCVFYHGIRVGDIYGKNTLFTYNLKQKIDLTEDRTLKYNFQAQDFLEGAILSSKRESFIKAVLLATDEYAEHSLVYKNAGTPGEVFLKTVAELYADRGKQINLSAIAVLKAYTTESLAPQAVSLNSVEEKQLEKAISFCHFLRFPVDGKPIIVVETLGDNVIGLAERDKIYISRQAFDIGTKMVANTLIEEYIHLRHGYADCTRAMQNFLFNKMISLGEQLKGEPL